MGNMTFTVSPMDQPRARSSGALESGLEVLEALAKSATGLGVSDIAAELSMDKGNVHRLLQTLVRTGYVQQDGNTKRYRASVKLVAVAGATLRHLDIRAAGEEVCNELVELTGESVHISQLTSSGPVYVLQRRPPFRVSVDTEIGARPPMHATATGKAILAFVPPSDRAEWLTRPLDRYTIRTIVTAEELERELLAIKSRGYSIDDEEFTPEVRCVAAPVYSSDGTVAGCVGVSSPIHRMDIARVPVVAEQLLNAARAITERLGGPVERYSKDALGKGANTS